MEMREKRREKLGSQLEPPLGAWKDSSAHVCLSTRKVTGNVESVVDWKDQTVREKAYAEMMPPETTTSGWPRMAHIGTKRFLSLSWKWCRVNCLKCNFFLLPVNLGPKIIGALCPTHLKI